MNGRTVFSGIGLSTHRAILRMALGLEGMIVGSQADYLFADTPLTPTIIQTMDDSFAFAIVLLFLFYVGGVAVDVVADWLVHDLIEENDNRRQWFQEATDYSPDGRLIAQEWIWRSDNANREFRDVAFAADFARGTAAVFGVGLLALNVVGALWYFGLAFFGDLAVQPEAWWSLLNMAAGVSVSVVMVKAWLNQVSRYHSLIADAGEIGRPGEGDF